MRGFALRTDPYMRRGCGYGGMIRGRPSLKALAAAPSRQAGNERRGPRVGSAAIGEDALMTDKDAHLMQLVDDGKIELFDSSSAPLLL